MGDFLVVEVVVILVWWAKEILEILDLVGMTLANFHRIPH
jgi:hypothetical protein